MILHVAGPRQLLLLAALFLGGCWTVVYAPDRDASQTALTISNAQFESVSASHFAESKTCGIEQRIEQASNLERGRTAVIPINADKEHSWRIVASRFTEQRSASSCEWLTTFDVRKNREYELEPRMVDGLCMLALSARERGSEDWQPAAYRVRTALRPGPGCAEEH